MKPLKFHTRAARGTAPVDEKTGALSVPIYQTASFAIPPGEAGRARAAGETEGFFYTRFANPTTAAFERDVAALEGAEGALAFNSGMAAISTAVLAHVGAGDRLVTQRQLYGGTAIFFAEQLPRFGVDVSYLDDPAPRAVAEAVTPKTKLVYLETPSNPLLNVVDIEGTSRAAREAGVPVVFDNTFATPYLQRPLELGATYVVHSTTKYFAGHDVIGGVLAGPAAGLHEIRKTIYKDLGVAPAPSISYQFIRGLKTLPLRMDRHCANARALAEFLARHEKVKKVYYPGLPEHPGHELAKRQMSQFGGILAFELADGAAARRFLDGLELCVFAVSFGDALTLVQHPPGVTHEVYEAERLAGAGMGPGFIRISAGLEDAEDIIADLTRALQRA
ncbi:MAG: methionine gamma-lyase [candidate division Zixibacteria bacterium]|nr:methionine gamma-lyase [candidate division Zixibacteria bacterium]